MNNSLSVIFHKTEQTEAWLVNPNIDFLFIETSLLNYFVLNMQRNWTETGKSI